MNVLSLFDGISCGMIALERANIKVKNYFSSEIESHAEGISKYNYPNIIRLGDVHNYQEWDLPKIDLLIGGSPCQDLSIAKANREGLNGEKSSLFYEYVKCLEKFKPKYFLLENNNSMPKEAKDEISKILGVEPIMINSSLVSGQMRKRLYWTNIPGVELPKDKNIKLQDILDSGFVDREKSLCITRRYAGFNGSQDYFRHRYFGKSFGQAVFEGNTTPEEHKDIYKKYGKYSGKCENVVGYLRQLTHNECERLQTLPKDYTKYEIKNGEIVETPKGMRYEVIGNGWTVDVISHIFSYIQKEEL